MHGQKNIKLSCFLLNSNIKACGFCWSNLQQLYHNVRSEKSGVHRGNIIVLTVLARKSGGRNSSFPPVQQNTENTYIRGLEL